MRTKLCVRKDHKNIRKWDNMYNGTHKNKMSFR